MTKFTVGELKRLLSSFHDALPTHVCVDMGSVVGSGEIHSIELVEEDGIQELTLFVNAEF